MKHKIIYYVLLLIGLFFASVAYYWGFESRDAKQNWAQHTAIVVELEKRQNRDKDGYVYAPVLEYNIEGRLLSKTHEIASAPPSYSIGERVAILVDPRNAEAMMVDSFWALYFWSVIFGIFGTIFGITGALGVFFLKNK